MADVRNEPPDEQNRMLKDDLPPLEVVQKMIKYETSLRLSQPVQHLFDLYHKDDNAITVVLDSIQQHVVERFGCSHVNALRTALARFPNDPVIRDAFYIKHNKITQGLVNQGQCAQDVKLFTLHGEKTTLFSQILLDQPELYRSHSPTMRLITIYIAEAHARDQWPAGQIISCVDQPTTLEQRLENAQKFKEKYKYEMPLLVDNMDNTFHLTYGSWPFRFYIINNGILVLKPEPGETTYSYDFNELEAWINHYINKE